MKRSEASQSEMNTSCLCRRTAGSLPGVWRHLASIFLAAAVMLAALALMSGTAYAAAGFSPAKGKVSAKSTQLRKEASASSRSLAKLSRGTVVTVRQEVFTGSGSSSARWYKVSYGKRTGYAKASDIKIVSYGINLGITVDRLDLKKGPRDASQSLGTIDWGKPVMPLLPAKAEGSSTGWYKIHIKGRTAYIRKAYTALITPPEPSPEVDLKGRTKLAAGLLKHPTYGGKARVVYTFSSKNCKRLFPVRGYKGVSTPQGLAYTGKRYYVLYGNNAGQRIVTYSAKGKRLKATRFAFSIGHPNGMTWDPATRLCYIFKGHQKRIYTWDPATNSFGKSATPFNASGGAYDPSTKMIYASSKPCMYTYSADGRFRLDTVFARCERSFSHSAQDCGAAGGFLFHAVSGANYRKYNYLDIYRISDRKYLGSVRIKMGEVESVVVGSKGYIELLINHDGTTDYVWRTPLKVKDLL